MLAALSYAKSDYGILVEVQKMKIVEIMIHTYPEE
jgi:hypothetical protein